MKVEYKIDRNILVLHDVLLGMTMYNYCDEIKNNLNKFISYLEQFTDKYNLENDIIDEELMCIITYEEK